LIEYGLTSAPTQPDNLPTSNYMDERFINLHATSFKLNKSLLPTISVSTHISQLVTF